MVINVNKNEVRVLKESLQLMIDLQKDAIDMHFNAKEGVNANVSKNEVYNAQRLVYHCENLLGDIKKLEKLNNNKLI